MLGLLKALFGGNKTNAKNEANETVAKPRAMRGFVGDLVYLIVIILVGILVVYNVFTSLSSEVNATGLWGLSVKLMGIIVPVVFILAVVSLLRRGQ